MVLKLGHFKEQFRNIWKILKCGAAKVQNISCTGLVKNEEVLHTVKDERNILHTI
jgi:hypothetical protein